MPSPWKRAKLKVMTPEERFERIESNLLAMTEANRVAAEGQAIEPPVVQGPITVTIRNCGTATDFFVVDLLVEV